MDAASAGSSGTRRGGLTMQDTLTPACVAFAIAFGLALGALVALGF